MHLFQSAAYSRPSSRASYQPRYEEEENHVCRGQQFGVYRRERGRSYGEDGDSGCCEQYRAPSMERTMSRNRVDNPTMRQGRIMMDMGIQQGRTMGMQQGRNVMDMGIQQGRRRNRNSNMLSAILCLLNEVDIPSLEVVEMAVRCRMQEMQD